jgi:hypothetical protein
MSHRKPLKFQQEMALFSAILAPEKVISGEFSQAI